MSTNEHGETKGFDVSAYAWDNVKEVLTNLVSAVFFVC